MQRAPRALAAQIIDGKAIALARRQLVKAQVDKLLAKGKRPPGLAVVLVGDNAASKVYVRNKQRACAEAGVLTFKYDLPVHASAPEVEQVLTEANENPAIDGILLQLPLPNAIRSDTDHLMHLIRPLKDVDGFHATNMGELALGTPVLQPCTPAGIIDLIQSVAPNDPHFLRGKDCVVVGASTVVGRPMALELLNRDATVTVTHVYTKDLAAKVAQADVVVAAAGVPRLVQGSWIKPGAVVIDVGINRLPNGKLCGDVDFKTAKERAAFITPVPGGVGPMTVAKLLENTLTAYQMHQ